MYRLVPHVGSIVVAILDGDPEYPDHDGCNKAANVSSDESIAEFNFDTISI